MKGALSLILLALTGLVACERGPKAPLYSCASEDTSCNRSQFTVVFRDSVADPEGLIESLAKKHHFTSTSRWNMGMKGFAAPLTEGAVSDLRREPTVAYIQQGGLQRTN
jgi:hypothetical protein